MRQKKDYLEPATEVMSLDSIQETMQSTSQLMMIQGADVTFETSSDFDSFFGNN